MSLTTTVHSLEWACYNIGAENNYARSEKECIIFIEIIKKKISREFKFWSSVWNIRQQAKLSVRSTCLTNNHSTRRHCPKDGWMLRTIVSVQKIKSLTFCLKHSGTLNLIDRQVIRSGAQYSAQYWIFEILISCIKFYLIVVQIIL